MRVPSPSGNRLVRALATRTREQRLTLVGALIFALVIGTISVTSGLPLKRGWVVAWVTLGVLCFGLGSLRRSIRDLALIWTPVFLGFWAYDLMRGQADALTARAALGPHLDIDRWLFGDSVSTVLQQHLFSAGDIRWYDYATWVVYQSHFVVPFAVALILWRMRGRLFRPYMATLVLLTYMALLTYVVYPAQPPWMASQRGAAGPSERVVHTMWKHVGVDRAAAAFSTTKKRKQGESAYSNPVAALPSLHAAYPVLILCCLWNVVAGRRRRHVVRTVLVAYPLAMGFALMYGAEHFTLDIVMGWAYAGIAWAVVAVAARRFAARPAHVPLPVVADQQPAVAG